jgi:ABC-2 type transport system permease protein
MSLLTRQSIQRVLALSRKDAEELSHQPGAVFPAVAMVFGSLAPAFLVVSGAPFISGRTLEQAGEFSDAALVAVDMVPELRTLTGNALIQAFLFHQFALLLLLVPVVAAMAIASHAVIGEKQAKALEPLLATPLTTMELLAAKTLTPFVFSTLLMWIALMLYLAGIAMVAEPGVLRAIVGVRLMMMFALLGPLVGLAALQLAVIVSSRATDPRSAQQLASLMILPITVLFVAQMMGAYVVSLPALAGGAAVSVVLNILLLWIGVRVFQRETILMRWR